MDRENQIDYIEFPVGDIKRAKEFYSSLFGWTFEDYGPDYTSFHEGRLSGSFFTASEVHPGGPLVVIYSSELEKMEKKIIASGGFIVRGTFSFPGGRRFHFADPSGNVLAVWSDK